MQRRLTLAATLVHDPELLYLDEPTAGVDPILRERFWSHFRTLRDEGKTIVVPTQYVGEAVVVRRGRRHGRRPADHRPAAGRASPASRTAATCSNVQFDGRLGVRAPSWPALRELDPSSGPSGAPTTGCSWSSTTPPRDVARVRQFFDSAGVGSRRDRAATSPTFDEMFVRMIEATHARAQERAET